MPNKIIETNIESTTDIPHKYPKKPEVGVQYAPVIEQGPDKPYITVPGEKWILEGDFKEWVLEGDIKDYELKQDMLERFEIEKVQREGGKEETLGIVNSILDERISELRNTFEKRLQEEINKLKKQKGEERLTTPFKW